MIKLARQPRPDTRELSCPELMMIPIDCIRRNPYQPRKRFREDTLTDLANSISQIGLIQPITVRKCGDGLYELVAGERRLRASRMAGLSHIKAVVMGAVQDRDIAMVALIENLQRENLHFFEEAEAYQSLIRDHGFTQEELARRLSKNQSTIANKLRILRLPPEVKEAITKSCLTERHARSLLRLHNEEAQLKLVEKIRKEAISVKETEQLVEEELQKIYGDEKTAEKPRPRVIQMRCNYAIYVNTIKQTLKKISANGVKTCFDEEDREDCTVLTIKLLKKSCFT